MDGCGLNTLAKIDRRGLKCDHICYKWMGLATMAMELMDGHDQAVEMRAVHGWVWLGCGHR